MREIVEVALFTGEVEAAKSFYGSLPAAVPGRPMAGWCDLRGRLREASAPRTCGRARGRPRRTKDHFALGVRALDDTCRELGERRVVLLVGPCDYPWGRSAYLRDPDGRLIELSQA